MQILVIKPPQMCCVAMILPFTFVLSFLQNQCSATELVKSYFVTEAGCGIYTPIRHLNFPKGCTGFSPPSPISAKKKGVEIYINITLQIHLD